jgi:hypothetical protein
MNKFKNIKEKEDSPKSDSVGKHLYSITESHRQEECIIEALRIFLWDVQKKADWFHKKESESKIPQFDSAILVIDDIASQIEILKNYLELYYEFINLIKREWVNLNE